MSPKGDAPDERTVVSNRKARHDYEILDRFEAGIVLSGAEVKSLRGGRGSLTEAFARVREGEVWIEGMHIPPYEQAMDKRTSMGVIGNLQAYTQFQAANAISDAAKNPGGLAGAGVGIGMGVGLGQQVANAMGQSMQSPGMTAPPPLPQATTFFVGMEGKQAGPFDLPTLQSMVASGQLKRDMLVWKQGMASWSKAGEVEELGPLFASVPPPLPS